MDGEKIEKIFKQVEKNEQETFSFLKKLISARSVTGKEMAAQLIVKEKFLRMGLEAKEVGADYRAIAENPEFKKNKLARLSKDKNRFNVIGSIGAGQSSKLLLFSHIDTIPARERSWESDPFAAKAKANRMYGRGSADNKCGTVIMTMALKSILDSNVPFRKEVILASTIGEEFGKGGFGYEGMFSCLGFYHKIDFAIGLHGRPQPEATLRAGGSGFLFFSTKKNEKGVFEKMEEINNRRLYTIDVFMERNPSLRELRYHYPSITPAEPRKTKFLPAGRKWWQLKVLPFENIRMISALLKKYFPGTETITAMQPFLLDPDHKFVGFVKDRISRLYGKEPALIVQDSGSDARFLSHAGVPVVSFGPFSGNAHAANEWVDLSDLIKCIKVTVSCILAS
jgi:succinyl-diaminopimelate desuccinylase